MPEFPKISDIPARLKHLIDNDIAVAHITVGKEGYEILVRSTQHHPKLGITTHKMYYVDEFLDLTSKISSAPMLDSPPTSPGRIQREVGQEVSNLAEATERIKARHLNVVNKAGITNQLSPSSLNYMDLAHPELADLQARAYYVAHKLGAAKIASRIASNDEFTIIGCRSVSEWWDRASPEQRFRVLSDSKSRGKAPPTCTEGLSPTYGLRMARLHCPFRNAEALLAKKEEEDDWHDLEEGASIL